MKQEQLLYQAIELAKQAHANQVDKGGKPYISHPLRVMDPVDSLEEKVVGVLHDAVEDSDLTLEDLTTLGFPTKIVRAIEAITKIPGEDYSDYLERVMANPVALRVKIADMEDNMDISRISHPTDKDRQRLEKYQATLPVLYGAWYNKL